MKKILLLVFLVTFAISCSRSTQKPVVKTKETKKEEAAALARIAENYVTEGINYHKKGENELAVKSWKKALDIIPEDAEVHNFTGIGYHKLYKLEEAEKHFKEAVRLNPNYFQAYNNLGFVLYQKKDYENAYTAFENSLNINPDFEAARLNLKRTKAILDGKLNSKVLELSEYASGFEWDLEKQIEIYKRILKLDSSYVEGHNNIAVAYFYSGSLDSAYYHLEMAVWLDNNYPEAINNLGYIYKIGGKYEEAIALFLKAISIKPQYIIALNNLGETYQLKGEYDNARRVFQTVLDLEPNNENAKDGLNQLSTLVEPQEKIQKEN